MRKSTKRLLLHMMLLSVALVVLIWTIPWLWQRFDWLAILRWLLIAVAITWAAILGARFVRDTYRNYRDIRKREDLLERFGDPAIVDDLLAQVIWQGETAEQVLASLGEPVAIEAKARRTKKQEVWKYGHEGGNRYRLRITLDDDTVVRWDMRT